MARWNSSERQRMVDDYLNVSGRNHFVPREFLDWLKGQVGHPAYDLFFGKSDVELAQAMREQMVRQWVNDLRITVREEQVTSTISGIVVREYPALVSPRGARRGGGGYVPMDSSDPVIVAELRAQGAVALDAWLSRYGGTAEEAGCDLGPIKEIAAILAGGVANAA